jgi:mannosyl-oligosaccharide alpha-1,2-mannosidase
MTRLSQLTGDPKYYDAIAPIVELFYRGQNQTALPGLFPMFVSMLREDVTTGGTFTLGGGADSLYEYFPKMHALLSGADPKLETLTRGFMDAAKQHLFFRPMVPDNDDILISGNVNVDADGAPRLDPETEHLTCFIGGTFALAGRLLRSEEDVEVGARLTRGCVYAYRAFATGIMPERLNMVACERGAGAEPCRWDEDRWVAEREKRPEYKPHLPKGFTTAKDPRYILRPEAIESVFYMYRITGDSRWQDVAWNMFRAVAKGTATELGSAALLDVTVSKWPPPLDDYMEVSSTIPCSSGSTTLFLTMLNLPGSSELLDRRDAQVLLPRLLAAGLDQPRRICAQHRGPSLPTAGRVVASPGAMFLGVVDPKSSSRV